MSFSKNLLFTLAASSFLSSHALTSERRDGNPSLPYDENTTKECTWWVDYDGSSPCAPMLEDNLTNLQDFRRWNPTIGPNCEGLTSGKSYCVEALFETPPVVTSQTPTPSSTSIPTSTLKISSSPTKSSTPYPSTTTKPSSTTPLVTPTPSSTKPVGNGIETPLPTQPDIVSNCDKFYFVKAIEQCGDIVSRFGITLDKFLAWNPKAGSNCAGLWAEAYACISIIGEEPASTTSKPTSIISSTTSAGNGVSTPQPTQPGMVTNCAKFHWIATGVTCGQVISFQKITLADFVKWNPTVGNDCTGMQANVNVCVGIIGGTTTTPTTISTKPSSTTTPGNGVATPQPTQPGMVTNCAKFHWIATGVTCGQVVSFQKITLAAFVKWNLTVGNDCTGMQANVNVCVGIIRGTTTIPTTISTKPSPTTTPGNGVATPQPTQPGMVTNCAKFHWIATGVTCGQVISFQKITLADFVKWNPTVGNDCTGMQANVNVCVGIIGGTTEQTTTPTPTTSAGNGIQTPQPTQSGMVTNCKKFHYAETGVVCSQITSYNKISLADFVKWNSGVGQDCKNMWAKTYTCVGV